VTNDPSTRKTILNAAKEALVETGYSGLSTRGIAQRANVPLSQIHYHFGTKQALMLEVLEVENQRLLARQERLYESDMPLWKQWEQACDFLEDDMESGYVRVLQELTAAGWADPEIAAAVKEMLGKWFSLLAEVAREAVSRLGDLGPFTPEEVALLTGAPFLGVETMLLLGFGEAEMPARSALRKVGELIRALEDRR